MNYDDIYEILKNASATTLSRFEQSGKAARAFVRRYHMWRFVVKRVYHVQYIYNYDEDEYAHMRPQMRSFLDARSESPGDEHTYWKRLYEFLDTRLLTWERGTQLLGFTTPIQWFRERDNGALEGRPVVSLTMFFPEIDEFQFTPGTVVAAFALDYASGADEPSPERRQTAFEIVVDEDGEGVRVGGFLKRRRASSDSMINFVLTPGGPVTQNLTPDGRFKVGLNLSATEVTVVAFLYQNIVTAEKLISTKLQTSFWI